MMTNYVAINGIENPEKIRVFIYSSGRMAHVPLNEILKGLNDEIAKLKNKIDKLEAR
ncbi:hypothetical protein [Bartonella tamiae]|uniref:hypothetical protein n=1 Tax=Bartonella tamiae TaxID=373638 RepID=UPI00026E77A1|nr:hypothetical protein [Bartonella tamiae]EJF92640.1 hypothetical protein MEG_01810 [Bartonella tamiae Th307]